MFRVAQTMVARNQLQVDEEHGIPSLKFIDKSAAAKRKNGAVLQAMQNRGLHATESIEIGFPQRFAFFYPLPGDRIVPMGRLVIPGHPAVCVPRMVSFFGDRSGANAHHIEGWSNQDQFFDSGKLLHHQPGNPSPKRVSHNGNRRATLHSIQYKPSVSDPIRQRIMCKLPFRFATPPHVLTAESPSLLLASLHERLALVPPSFREEAGDGQNLTIFADRPIPSNPLSI